MNKTTIDLTFWINMFLLTLLLVGIVIIKYVSQEKWVTNIFDGITYLYMFSVGYWLGKNRKDKPSTLKGP